MNLYLQCMLSFNKEDEPFSIWEDLYFGMTEFDPYVIIALDENESPELVESYYLINKLRFHLKNNDSNSFFKVLKSCDLSIAHPKLKIAVKTLIKHSEYLKKRLSNKYMLPNLKMRSSVLFDIEPK